MRVTQNSIANASLANLQASLQRVSSLQEQMTSGKVINRPSDSPTGTGTSLSLRAEISANEQYSRNASDGKAWLGTQDSTLQAVNALLQHVRGLTLQGSSTGNMDDAARKALATEVSAVRDTLVGLANTTYAGRPLFGGTTAGSSAFATSAPYDYTGDSGTVARRIDSRSTVSVGGDGSAVFGSGATSVFALLDKISTDLTTNTAGLSADLGDLDSHTSNVLQTLTDVGVRYSRVEAAGTTADDKVLSLRATLSGVEDIDLPSTIMELQMQQTAYQAALGATAKVIQPSLMDFLR